MATSDGGHRAAGLLRRRSPRRWFGALLAVAVALVIALPEMTLAGAPRGRSCGTRTHLGGRGVRSVGQRRGFTGGHRRSWAVPRLYSGSRNYAAAGFGRSFRRSRRSVGGYLRRYDIGISRSWPSGQRSRSTRVYLSAPALGFYSPSARYVERYYTSVPAGATVTETSYAWPDSADLAERAWSSWEPPAPQSKAGGNQGERRVIFPANRGAADRQAASTERARLVGIALGRGDKSFEGGRYAEAREEYVRALVVADGDVGVRLALGISEFALGRFADASRAIRTAVARKPQLAITSFDLREAYGLAGDFQTHLAALQTFIKGNRDDAEARFLVGFVRFFAGDRQGGLAALEEYRSTKGYDKQVAPFIEMAESMVGADGGGD